jgi:hypothetical protein
VRVRHRCDPYTSTSRSNRAGGTPVSLPLTPIPSRRFKHDKCYRSGRSTNRNWLRGLSRLWRMVVAPTTLRGVRAHRMLRQLPESARNGPCDLVGSPCHPQLRAGRGLVLELPDQQIHKWTPPRTSAASSPRPAGAWSSRPGSRQLARPPGVMKKIRRRSPRDCSPNASRQDLDGGRLDLSVQMVIGGWHGPQLTAPLEEPTVSVSHVSPQAVRGKSGRQAQ